LALAGKQLFRPGRGKSDVLIVIPLGVSVGFAMMCGI